MKQRLDKHFLLNRAFVGTLLAIAVPIALQNMISFGVAVMDSVMLGSFGDVAIAASLPKMRRSSRRAPAIWRWWRFRIFRTAFPTTI